MLTPEQDMKIRGMLEELRSLADGRDTEGDHLNADGLLIQIIHEACPGELGVQIDDAFQNVGKWYA